MAAVRNIYVDVSDLIAYALANSTLSGIQRVSVMVLNKLVNAGLAANIRLLSFNRSSGEISSYSAELFKGNFSYDQEAFCAYFRVRPTAGRSQYYDLHSYILTNYGRSLKGQFHFYRLTAIDYLSKGEKFDRLGIAARSGPPDNFQKGVPSKPVIVAGDVIFVPGATWGMDPLLNFLAQARQNGAKIIQFIHDLVPLIVPEHVVDGVSHQFFNWITKMTDISHGYIVNSEWTKKDLLKFIHAHGKNEHAIIVVPLAHQFSSNSLITNDDNVSSIFINEAHNYKNTISNSVYNAACTPYVLCVGTLKSRKNIFALARVWIYLEKELGLRTPRLIFSGNSGWLRDDFNALLRGSSGCNGLIRVVERPFDHELEYLYRNCLFTVYPSYYEGWGLPVGESLWFGKPVVSSNTSSMPEVGGTLADYIDPNNAEELRS